MTPSILAFTVIALVAAVIVLVTRRVVHAAGTLDPGMVSSRWLSELRRDDPQSEQ